MKNEIKFEKDQPVIFLRTGNQKCQGKIVDPQIYKDAEKNERILVLPDGEKTPVGPLAENVTPVDASPKAEPKPTTPAKKS